MKIKRYLVKNMSEALKEIKIDLGPEAVIVSTRKVRQKGWLKFFKPRVLEVTAVVDDKILEPEVDIAEEDKKIVPVKKELAEVKSLLEKMVEKDGGKAGLDKIEEKWWRMLVDMDIKDDIAKSLVIAASIKCPEDHPEREEFLKIALTTEITEKLDPLYSEKGFKQKIIAFIGPTGVGKTTTIAKLAAQFTLFHKQKVGLVTMDTYRIGAVEQLKTYGEIIGVPVNVVMTPQELREIVDQHTDKEYILIDTAGRSSKNTMKILELKAFLEAVQPVEAILVLSSTTKTKDIDEIIKEFQELDFKKIIFTKTDETNTLGCILNAIFQTNKQVSFITDGQNVPDDIQHLYPKKVAKMILRGVEK